MIEDADGDIQATELGQLEQSHLTPHLFGVDPRAHRATYLARDSSSPTDGARAMRSRVDPAEVPEKNGRGDHTHRHGSRTVRLSNLDLRQTIVSAAFFAQRASARWRVRRQNLYRSEGRLDRSGLSAAQHRGGAWLLDGHCADEAD
jgi:hypothetical protein